MKCGFCSTGWKTRKAKGTRSAFSWTATFVCLAALIVVAFLLGRELGVLQSSQVKPTPGESTNVSTDYSEDAEYVDGETTPVEEDAEEVDETPEDAAAETAETPEDAATETTETLEGAATE